MEPSSSDDEDEKYKAVQDKAVQDDLETDHEDGDHAHADAHADDDAATKQKPRPKEAAHAASLPPLPHLARVAAHLRGLSVDVTSILTYPSTYERKV